MAAKKTRTPGRTPISLEVPNAMLAQIETYTDEVQAAEPHRVRNRHAAILALLAAGLEARAARPRLKRAGGTR